MQEYKPPIESLNNFKRSKSREQNNSNSQHNIQNKTLYHAPIRKTIVHKSSSNLNQPVFGSLINQNLQDDKNSLLEQFMVNQGKGGFNSTTNQNQKPNQFSQKNPADLLDTMKINNRSNSNNMAYEKRKQPTQIFNSTLMQKKKNQMNLKPMQNKKKNYDKDFMNPVFPNEDEYFQKEENNYEKTASMQLNTFKINNEKNQNDQSSNENQSNLKQNNLNKKQNSETRLPKLSSEQFRMKKKLGEVNSNILRSINNNNTTTIQGSIDYQTYKQDIQKSTFMQQNFSSPQDKKQFSDKNINNENPKEDNNSNKNQQNEQQFSINNSNNRLNNYNFNSTNNFDRQKKLKKTNQTNNLSDLDKFKSQLNKKQNNQDTNQYVSNGFNAFNQFNNSLTNSQSTTNNNSKINGLYKGLYSSQNKRANSRVQQKTRSFTPGQVSKKPSDFIINNQNSILNGNDSSKVENSILQTNNANQNENNDKKINFINQISHSTRAGANLQGPKTNQDSYIIKKNLNKNPNRFIFSVCDGHGQYGHLVSAFIKTTLQKKIEQNLERENDNLDDEFIRNSLSLSFLQTSQALLESNIDCTFSGTTCCLVLIIDEQIWTANVGDSRATLARGKGFSNYKAIPLTIDHKVDSPAEMERILKKGGRPEPYRDHEGNQVGPYRVWLKDEDLPGLAMARSFGDIVATQAGVICEPEIIKYDMTEEDRFMVVCSDGVWEFIEDQQAVNYVLPFYIKSSPEQACQKLVKESVILWKKNDDVIDDITAVAVFFKRPQRIIQQKNTQQSIIQQHQNNNFVLNNEQ